MYDSFLDLCITFLYLRFFIKCFRDLSQLSVQGFPGDSESACNGGKKLCHHQRSPLGYSFIITLTVSITICNFVIIKNEVIAYNLLKLTFCSHYNALDIHPSCFYSLSIFHFFLLLSSIQWYGCTIVWLTIYLLKDDVAVSSFFTITQKAAINNPIHVSF